MIPFKIDATRIGIFVLHYFNGDCKGAVRVLNSSRRIATIKSDVTFLVALCRVL